MKLSKAIRIGAGMREQGFGALFTREYRYLPEQKIYSCAIGAGMEGAGFCAADDDNWNRITYDLGTLRRFDGLESLTMGTKFTSPAEPDESPEDLDNVIISLNDNYKWSREQIANWLESIGF